MEPPNPRTKVLRDYTNFVFEGNISPNLVENIQRAVGQQEPVPDPDKPIAEFNSLKELGKFQFQHGDPILAWEAYRKVVDGIALLRNGYNWPALAASGGSQFVATIAKLYWAVHLNQLSNMTESMRDLQNQDPMKLDHISNRAIHIMESAVQVVELFSFEWRPDLSDIAKFAYRMAVVQRMRGELDEAHMFLQQALLHSPGDLSFQRNVQRKALKIGKARAAQRSSR